MRQQIISAILMTILLTPAAFADYKITQQQSMGPGMVQEITIYSKGVRERHEYRTITDNPQMAAAMAKMTPPIHVSQCDLKQDLYLSEPKKAYFIDYYDWSGLSPEQKKRRPSVEKMVIKGTATMSSVVVDSGKRQMMFGLEAKWLKWVMSIETSMDSCDGPRSTRMEREGWFVTFSLEHERCQVPKPPPAEGGCRPKFVIKSAQQAGFFLEGTIAMYNNNKLQGKMTLKTTELSKATLDQALFEAPKDWKEADAYSELMPGFSDVMRDTSAKTYVTGQKGPGVKTIAIDFFSGGGASKVNQEELRSYIAQKLAAGGLSGYSVNSQADISSGNYPNVIGVEVKKVKESGASKIGGLFGKVTGTDTAKIGDSEAEIIVTVYGKDGKTVVATASSTQKVKGKGDDAVKAALDQVLPGLIEKMK